MSDYIRLMLFRKFISVKILQVLSQFIAKSKIGGCITIAFNEKNLSNILVQVVFSHWSLKSEK